MLKGGGERPHHGVAQNAHKKAPGLEVGIIEIAADGHTSKEISPLRSWSAVHRHPPPASQRRCLPPRYSRSEADTLNAELVL